MEDPNHITYFGVTDYRNKETKFGIRAEDRARHMYIIGKTGVGKSTLLENMAVQDIQNGNGLAVVDPHGNMAEKLLEYIPENRLDDVIYFAPFDLDHPIAFNVMEDIGKDKRHLVVSGLMSVFKKIWADAWSARMEYILNNTLLALLEYKGATLMAVNRMLSDKEFRKEVVANVTDIAVKSFWENEFANYTERMAAEAVPAIQNKIGQFTANPLIRNIIGQPTSSFDVRKLMDEKKILIVNLSKGRIGEQNTNLLGGLIITKIYLAAMSRAEMSSSDLKKAPSFYFYVDEFQNFANESFADILSEARKYKLALTVANQYVAQMVDEVRDAILGNVGTLVTFRIGPSDAELFEKEFAPTFNAEDLVNLNFAQIYLRLMINGMSSKPFSARTMGPIETPTVSLKQLVIDASRRNFSTPKHAVEESLKSMLEFSPKKENKKEPKKPVIKQENSTDEKKEGEPKNNHPFKKAFSNIDFKNTISLKETVHHNTQKVDDTNKIVKPSEKLQQILKELEEPVTPEIKKVPDDGLPLSLLKKDKSADPEKVSALREALKTIHIQNKKPELPKTQIHVSLDHQQKNTQHTIVSNPETKDVSQKKEIPEDVLRKVLDSE